ncbi:MAG: KAP family P-loop NTPase fold protein, partial [Cytophaga sp.]|uniref:KAP family P-loop NTPase fold protein n=1 Tax=Cytophaga sp. TaxID=29535 RepID=UPI003F7F7E07
QLMLLLIFIFLEQTISKYIPIDRNKNYLSHSTISDLVLLIFFIYFTLINILSNKIKYNLLFLGIWAWLRFNPNTNWEIDAYPFKNGQFAYIDFLIVYVGLVIFKNGFDSIYPNVKKISSTKDKTILRQSVLNDDEYNVEEINNKLHKYIWFAVVYFRLFRRIPIKEYSYGFINPDLPLNEEVEMSGNKSLSDLDTLGRNKFASKLADAITLLKPSNSFSIGIVGEWGSGKTSFMSLILNQLKLYHPQHRTKIIRFYPWFYNNSESLLKNFFKLLENEFKNSDLISSQFNEYYKAILKTETNIFKTDFSKLLMIEDKGLYNQYLSLKNHIKKLDCQIIITIDDLDRLDNNEIVDVFRIIRILADFPNTIYIVGYDKFYINNAIKEKISSHKPEKYLDKIINLEFQIPELDYKSIIERLRNCLLSSIENLENNKTISKINPNELEECLKFSDIPLFLKNDRDIKKFTNSFIIKYMNIGNEVYIYHFFLLELINFSDPELYLKISINRDNLI